MRDMIGILGSWGVGAVFLIGWIAPALGAVNEPDLSSLFRQYGKARVIGAVLKLRDNRITVQVEGALREFTGPPAPEFVNEETLSMDLAKAGADTRALEQAISAMATEPADLQPQAATFRLYEPNPLPGSRHPLWSVEKDGRRISLLGSVHLLKPDAYPLSGAIEEAYSASRTIAFEMDIGQLDDPGTMGKMMAMGRYPSGKDLVQSVSTKTYRTLEDRVTALGLSMAQFDRLRPWLCAIIIMGIEFRRLGYEPRLGLDRHLFRRAERDGKTCVFFETLEEQLGLFAAMDEREQESLLKQSLADLEMAPRTVGDMVRAWKSGDMERLGGLLHASFEDHPEVYERLMVQRNREWLTKVESLMGQGEPALVIVGAGHLVGRDSLLDLLKSKGYKVRQM